MIELDRFRAAPTSYIVEYAHLFAGGRSEFAQRYGATLVKLVRSIDYVDSMPHTTWKLFSRTSNGSGVAEWMGPIISVTHLDGQEVVYVEDYIDPRIPVNLTLNPQAVLLDVLFERSFTHPPEESHLGGDIDPEDS